jgi:hypothetical protein
MESTIVSVPLLPEKANRSYLAAGRLSSPDRHAARRFHPAMRMNQPRFVAGETIDHNRFVPSHPASLPRHR